MKKIWLFCLCLTCLSLAGCFHIPDEDWLPSRNKINTWDTHRDEEMEQALNSFMDWINMISSDWNELKNEEIVNNEFESEEVVENVDEIIDNESENHEITENIISEE